MSLLVKQQSHYVYQANTWFFLDNNDFILIQFKNNECSIYRITLHNKSNLSWRAHPFSADVNVDSYMMLDTTMTLFRMTYRRSKLKLHEEMIIWTIADLAVGTNIRLLISVESNCVLYFSFGVDISTCISGLTHWLASPSPSILGTYGAGISRLYNLSQSTSANHPWANISEEPALKLPYRLVRSPINRFFKSSFASTSKYVG